jgi:signal transduction histidine kinase
MKQTVGSTELQLSADELAHISRLVTIGELSACFAHEVFNPLMMMRGHLRFAEEMMIEGDPLRSHFEVVDRAARRIEDMARRMLDFSRKRVTEYEYCNIRELIEEAVNFVQPYLHSNTVMVQLEIGPILDEIPVDRWQLIQAFVNLMQNAADAMAGCSRRVLTVSAVREDQEIRITFADTGPGLAVSDVGRVFEPFFTTKGPNGTGLGLYVTRRVVEEHRGTITVQTNDRGATFTISLPLK